MCHLLRRAAGQGISRHDRDAAVIIGQPVDARLVAAVLDAAAHVAGDLLHGREPDVGLVQHVRDQLLDPPPTRQAPGGEGVPDPDPEPAVENPLPGEPVPFDKVKKDANDKLWKERYDQAIKRWDNILRASSEIVIYEDRLQSILSGAGG